MTQRHVFRQLSVYFLLFLILLLSLYLRRFTFWHPHWQGDQAQYVTLAMKLVERGFNSYNLSEVEIRVRPLRDNPDWSIVYPLFKSGIAGDFYRAYGKFGFNYYNEMPFYYKAPLFPVALTLSHQLFAPPGFPYVVANIRQGVFPGDHFNRQVVNIQFWAVVVPVFSHLLMVLLTFFLAKRYFSDWAAICSAFLLAIHPVSIVASQRILNDEFTAVWITASLLAFLVFYERKSYIGVLFAGVLAGLAILSRQNAGLCIFTVWIYSALISRRVLNLYFLCYMLGAVFISAHWFIQVFAYYGTPLYEPDMMQKILEDKTGWFELLNRRPHSSILFAVGIPYLCPPFLWAYASLKRFVQDLRAMITEKIQRSSIVFLWLWILPFYLFYMGRVESKEHRYMLMAYPALAILAAVYLEKTALWLEEKLRNPLAARAIVCVFFAVSTIWSVSVCRDAIYRGMFLIYKPF